MNMAKVLLIEDIPLIQRIHSNFLEALRCIVDIAKNGKEALTLYQKDKYALIFLDIGLPDMNGVDVCKSIRAKKDYVPIIALTAQGWHVKDDCIKAGVNCLIQKPITKETFREILLHWIPNY